MEHAEVCGPRTDGVAILVGHDPGELMQVGEVVDGPGGQELGQGYRSEGWMGPAAGEVVRLQIQRLQRDEIVRAEASEVVEELVEGLAVALFELR